MGTVDRVELWKANEETSGSTLRSEQEIRRVGNLCPKVSEADSYMTATPPRLVKAHGTDAVPHPGLLTTEILRICRASREVPASKLGTLKFEQYTRLP